MLIDPNPTEWLDYDESPLLIKVSVVMPILSVMIVGLRIWSRKIGRTHLGMDDWLIILAQAFSFGIPVAAVLSALHGVGKHIEVVEAEDPNNMQWAMGILFVGELAYISLIALIKVSILQLYDHVFPTPYMRKGVMSIYVLLALWTVACMILTIFQCTPINAAWDKALVRTGGGHCVNQGAYFIGVAVPHTATDVLILALPLFELRKLHMPTWKKWAIGGIFLLGGFIVIVSIVRLTTLIAMYNAGDGADTTVLLMPVELWTVTEVSVAIICACLPILGPLVSRFGPATLHLLSTRRKGKASGYTTSTSSGCGRTPGGSDALESQQGTTVSDSSKNAPRKHHHRFSATRSHNFQRLEGDSSSSTRGTFTCTNRDREGDGQYYPKVTPAGWAAEQDIEISSGGRADGVGVGVGVGCGAHGTRAASQVGTRETRLVKDEGCRTGDGDEIPLQGIYVEHHMTWAETSSDRS